MTMAASKMNMKELDAEAKSKATSQIINMLQRPGQLEKIEQFKRTLTRKRLSVEALLKSAMQQQLDGVKYSLIQMKFCSDVVIEIINSVKKINGLLAEVPHLCNVLNEVRDENMRHSQYVTAIENLKHIFTVPESVEKTKQWINEGKLLHTHQCLRDLENSRDDLLYELHKLPNQSPHDTSMLKAYFADVEVLSKLLEKQLRLILSRTLNTVRKEPAVIVTALRIIDREEKSDEEALKQQKQTGFLPPGRPKRWKDMCFDVLKKSVETRIVGTQVQERDDNKLWLVTYLELIRMLILEDLRVVKTLCVPCFPPKYNIMEEYIKMYHTYLARHLEEIIQNGLQGTEYVTLLSWLNQTYKSNELMGYPDLREHTMNLPLLLPQAVVDRLEQEYLKNIENNYTEWMQNTLRSEQQEWNSNTEPHVDTYSRTAAPIIIYQMIDQNLTVTKTISIEITIKVLNLSIEQVLKFGESFRDGIIEFKNKYFEDRKKVPYFTQYMIMIVNNCLQLADLGSQFEKQYLVDSNSPELAQNFNRLRGTFISLRNEAGNYLLDEVFIDLEQHFVQLFTPQWITTTLPLDTIYATLEDYFQDYSHLVDANYNFVLEQAKNMVVKKYLTSLLSKRTSFKTFDECLRAAEKISKETEQLRKLFSNLSKDMSEDKTFDCIVLLCEIIKSDNDMLSFELHRVVEKYPDLTEDHLLRVLYFRGDLIKSDVKEKVSQITRPKGNYQNSIFSTLVLPKAILNF